jgi:energy-coupling factor transport system substrate-specific component
MNYRSAAKNTAAIAVMAAILVAVKYALWYLPNIEAVTPLIIIFTCVFGFRRSVFAVLIFCLIDNFIYTFSYLVTVQYFFHWPLLCLLAEITHKIFRQNFIAFGALAAFAAVVFWIETPVIHVIFKISPFTPTLLAGVPFMFAMLISGTAVTLVTFKPLYSLLIKINI